MLSVQFFLALATGFLVCSQVSSYKILVVVPPPARSHYNLGKGVADILHERNHEVTLISSFKNDKPAYRELTISKLMDLKNDSMVNFDMASQSKLDTIRLVSSWMELTIRMLMEDPDVQKLYTSKEEKFDLLVIEHFMNEALIGIAVKFNCPVLLISPVSMMSWLATFTGNSISPATVPNVFLPLSNNMNLLERTLNTGMALFQEVMGWWTINPTQRRVYEEVFTAESKILPFDKLSTKVAMVLINSHPVLNVARPLLPNAIEVGGYHIGDPKPLPQDLQKILDNAKDGVIYFSMGSNLKSSLMSKEVQQGILKSFSKLKQTILWKFEADLPGRPDNVIIRKWMPQDAILAHPNVKIFISHGGLLSLTETIHFGPPLLTIPIFGDQNHNARGIQERGHGVVVEYSNLTETSLTWALNEMLTNPKYEQNAKRLNKLYHDRPMRPRDLVAFYAEHAIRSGGAPHLSPPKLCRCSELLLDVAALITIPPLLVFILVIMACRKCFKTKDDKKKQNKEGGSKKKN